MSEYHIQDIDGCDYTMSVIKSYDNRITSWSHTEGEYDKYDMDWTCDSKFEGRPEFYCQDENKDRRYGWKTDYDENGNKVRVKNYDRPQYLSTYSSQMFNYEKYEPMMERYEQTRQVPIYTAGYLDGVWICDLRKLPKDLIYKDRKDGGWRIYALIEERTMDGQSKKVWQPRFLIPNEYGRILKKK